MRLQIDVQFTYGRGIMHSERQSQNNGSQDDTRSLA
jgi:redox-sensitive bicupin YhaK (pirin superfamily)